MIITTVVPFELVIVFSVYGPRIFSATYFVARKAEKLQA